MPAFEDSTASLFPLYTTRLEEQPDTADDDAAPQLLQRRHSLPSYPGASDIRAYRDRVIRAFWPETSSDTVDQLHANASPEIEGIHQAAVEDSTATAQDDPETHDNNQPSNDNTVERQANGTAASAASSSPTATTSTTDSTVTPGKVANTQSTLPGSLSSNVQNFEQVSASRPAPESIKSQPPPRDDSESVSSQPRRRHRHTRSLAFLRSSSRPTSSAASEGPTLVRAFSGVHRSDAIGAINSPRMAEIDEDGPELPSVDQFSFDSILSSINPEVNSASSTLSSLTTTLTSNLTSSISSLQFLQSDLQQMFNYADALSTQTTTRVNNLSTLKSRARAESDKNFGKDGKSVTTLMGDVTRVEGSVAKIVGLLEEIERMLPPSGSNVIPSRLLLSERFRQSREPPSMLPSQEEPRPRTPTPAAEPAVTETASEPSAAVPFLNPSKNTLPRSLTPDLGATPDSNNLPLLSSSPPFEPTLSPSFTPASEPPQPPARPRRAPHVRSLSQAFSPTFSSAAAPPIASPSFSNLDSVLLSVSSTTSPFSANLSSKSGPTAAPTIDEEEHTPPIGPLPPQPAIRPGRGHQRTSSVWSIRSITSGLWRGRTASPLSEHSAPVPTSNPPAVGLGITDAVSTDEHPLQNPPPPDTAEASLKRLIGPSANLKYERRASGTWWGWGGGVTEQQQADKGKGVDRRSSTIM